MRGDSVGITVQVALTNLIPNGSFETDSSWSGVTYDATDAKWGSRSQKFAAGGTYVGSCPMQSPTVGHIYYGRHYIKTAGDATPSDCRFEWYAGDGAGLNFVFGWNRGDHADWYMESSRIQVTAVNGSSYICRSFVVNTNFTVWADGLMIVDLTEAFGAGNEPSKGWCDENIPFFDGSTTIGYEVEMIVDRTQADVDNGTDKGHYNASDLNRVEGAVSYLCGLLQSTPEELQDYAESLGVAWNSIFDVPYDPEDYDLTVKLDWTMEDYGQPADVARYLSNVETLIGTITAAYPTLPSSMARLDYNGANAIERALVTLYDALMAEEERITGLLDNTAAAWYYSGDVYAGEI